MGVAIINELMGGGLNAFYWYQIFALGSGVVEAQNVKLAWRIPKYCYV